MNAMRKEVFESGHMRERGGRRDLQEATESEGSRLSAFLHSAARDKLLPLLTTDCQATHRHVSCGHVAGHGIVTPSRFSVLKRVELNHLLAVFRVDSSG